METIQPLLGILALPAIAWLMSENRRAFPWFIAAAGLLIQIVFVVALVRFDIAHDFFLQINRGAQALAAATQEGTGFVFGYLGGAPLPFEENAPGASFILAFGLLPLIFVISALSALFWHWRILPAVIKVFSISLNRIFSLRGGVGVASAANVFFGMVDSPLIIRPIFASLSRADIFLIMSCGMATIAGTVLVLYSQFLTPVMADPLEHLLTASVISVPAAIIFARIMIPSPESSADGDTRVPRSEYSGGMDALTQGTQQAMSPYFNILFMLIVLLALVYLCNAFLSFLPHFGGGPVTLQAIFGVIFKPLMWLIGIPWSEAHAAGALMGTKTALNEFIAYIALAGDGGAELSERSKLIMVYAMSGFANFGSVGIMVGGLSAIAPSRRSEITALGLRSLIPGTLATCMTGAVVAIAG